MSPLTLSQLITLYSWFPLAVLLFFLLLIARFYQKFSGNRTFFRLFLIPIVCFGFAAVRYTSINHISGDLAANLAFAVGGLTLIALSLFLYFRMTAGRR